MAAAPERQGEATRRPAPAWLPNPALPNPALRKHQRERAEDAQNRIADRITDFAGSMRFVYIHVAWFALWIATGVEHYPFGLLTMIVSLEAIFLSTFVLISQNRADARRQVIADLEWKTVQEEDLQNQQLLDLVGQLLDLTRQVHEHTAGLPTPGASDRPVDDAAGGRRDITQSR